MKFVSNKTAYLLLLIGTLTSCQKAESIEPAIKSLEAQNISNSDVTMVGELEDMGARTNWDYGFVWSDLPGPDVNSGNLIYIGNRSMEGIFSIQQDDLRSATTYYFKSFVSDPGFSTIYYGNERDFTTLP